MKKKLTIQGPTDRSSFTITLPKEWIIEHNLSKKRIVEMNLVGDKVIISPDIEEQKTISIDAEKYEKTLIKLMQGVYRAGLNDIKLSYTNSSTFEQIISISEKLLIGYEVIEQKKNYIIIRDITLESEQSFKVLLRRVFLLIFEIFDAQDKKAMEIVNKNVKKLANYCQRILIKKGHTDYKKTPIYYIILDRLEKIAEEIIWLYETSMNKEEEKIFLEIKILFRKAYELFYKFNNSTYNESTFKSYNMKNDIRSSQSTQRSSIHLHNITRIINSLYGDILIVCIDE